MQERLFIWQVLAPAHWHVLHVRNFHIDFPSSGIISSATHSQGAQTEQNSAFSTCASELPDPGRCGMRTHEKYVFKLHCSYYVVSGPPDQEWANSHQPKHRNLHRNLSPRRGFEKGSDTSKVVRFGMTENTHMKDEWRYAAFPGTPDTSPLRLPAPRAMTTPHRLTNAACRGKHLTIASATQAAFAAPSFLQLSSDEEFPNKSV